MQYYSTLKAKLIYIFTINDAAHTGCVKIGEATLDEATDSTLLPNSKELNASARKRIDQYTKTAGIQYTLRHTELTMSIHGGMITTFNDKAVHEVLLRSGVQRHDFSLKNQGKEWFECSVETALKAIRAVKEGRSAISANDITDVHDEIEFRPEQLAAIEKTTNKFRKRPAEYILTREGAVPFPLVSNTIDKKYGKTQVKVAPNLYVIKESVRQRAY